MGQSLRMRTSGRQITDIATRHVLHINEGEVDLTLLVLLLITYKMLQLSRHSVSFLFQNNDNRYLIARPRWWDMRCLLLIGMGTYRSILRTIAQYEHNGHRQCTELFDLYELHCRVGYILHLHCKPLNEIHVKWVIYYLYLYDELCAGIK